MLATQTAPTMARDDQIDDVSELDRLTLTDDVTTRTLDGYLPYVVDGFDWVVQTDRPHRTGDTRGWSAVGADDGSVVARGIVDHVRFGADRERTILHVRPPAFDEQPPVTKRHKQA